MTRECSKDRGPADTFARFMGHVERGVRQEECWTWTGNKPDGRYGHFSIGGQVVKAHRWIYETVVGPIPDGLMMRHRCDNPSCVNPRHLEPGTASDNMRDKIERGRGADRRGEKHPLAKLGAPQVLDIRKRAACGATHQSLADEYGVRRGQIGKIVQRLNWRHI